VFDSDVMVKPPVRLALDRLRRFLASRGARVFVIYLPAGKDGAKVGLDDYLAADHSPDDLLALATAELRESAPDTTRDCLPTIVVTNRPLRDITNDAVNA